MKKIVKVDSLNLSSYSFENLFTNQDKYKIIQVYGIGYSDKPLWLKTFGAKLSMNIIEAKIVFCNNGSSIPLKRYASNPSMQTIEFAGLEGYDERSRLLRELLIELLPQLNDAFVRRCDICIDNKRYPNHLVNKLLEKRRPFPYINTTYYKTEKEKKTNNTMDIKLYDKSIEAKLDYPLYRVEFVFKGAYFQNKKLSDLNYIFKKCQKSIFKFSCLDCQIKLLS